MESRERLGISRERNLLGCGMARVLLFDVNETLLDLRSAARLGKPWGTYRLMEMCSS